MKNPLRYLAIVFVVAGLLATVSPASAAPISETETVTLTATPSGNSVTLTATTLKHGSAFTDSWDGAKDGVTTLNSDGYYVSTATFTPSGPGTYTVTYHITMTAGLSDVTWTGTVSVQFQVAPDGTTTRVNKIEA